MRHRQILLALSIIILYLASPVNIISAQTTATPIPVTCEDLVAKDRPRFSGPNAPTIRITTPTDGSTLYGSSFTISVDIQNFDLLTTDGRHWHLWVNGQ